jgi:hypothetical protein
MAAGQLVARRCVTLRFPNQKSIPHDILAGITGDFMRMTLDRGSFVLRLLATGVVALVAALAGCGRNDSLYTFNASSAVAVADFNGSGYPGMAVAVAQIDQLNPAEKPGYVAIALQNTSTPGAYEPSVHFATQGNPSAMAVGAFRPGSVDIAVANVNDTSVSVLLETAPNSGSFQTAMNLSIGSPATGVSMMPQDLAICDVNGDGNPDIVVAYQLKESSNISGNLALTPVGGGVTIILQTSPGTFGTATNLGSAPLPSGYAYPNVSYGVACANLSGDNNAPPDIVMTSFSAYDIDDENGRLYNEGTVSIFFHDPNNLGSFLPRVDLKVPGALSKVVIADVNGDGLPDIIVADEAADATGAGASGAVVLLQNKPAVPGAQPTFAAPVTYSTYSANGIAVGDVNGDGYPDIVVSSAEPAAAEGGTGSISVLLNTKATPGVFQAAVTYSGLGAPASVAIGNLAGKAGSSLPDLAIADDTGVAVMLNQTSAPGTFAAETLVGG